GRQESGTVHAVTDQGQVQAGLKRPGMNEKRSRQFMRKKTDAGPKVLLVDDEPDLLEMYREILGQLPSKPEIQTATSGPRALALLEAEEFRLMICDLMMPKMDGLQLLSVV